MSDRSLVSPALRIVGVGDKELDALLELVAGPSRGARWVAGQLDQRTVALWPPDGRLEEVQDPKAFIAAQDEPGFVFPGGELEAFLARFPEVANQVGLLQVAGIVAPVIPNLHPRVGGVNYDLAPAPGTQRVINIFGRF